MPTEALRRMRHANQAWLGVALLIFMVAILVVAARANNAANEAKDAQVSLRDAQIAACGRGIADRVVARDESLAAYRANKLVASDPKQPARTRLARSDQATSNMAAVLSRESRLPLSMRRTSAGRSLPEFNCEAVVKAR
jgi:cbb3-type cytochrome oxidase subunit 3